MKKKLLFSLQLFTDGGDGGTGTGAGSAGNGDGGQKGNAGGTGPGGTYSFEQAEEIANARADRAEKAALTSYFKQQGMTEDEVKALVRIEEAQRAEKKQFNDLSNKYTQRQNSFQSMQGHKQKQKNQPNRT